MKRQNSVRRTGAVLLLILGLMAMFAVSILTYMVVTSNMAETAQNSAKLDATLAIPAQEDVDAALKNIVIGSNNERNPIGPFSILENMYGDWKEYDAGSEDSSTEFLANIDIFPNLGIATVTPIRDLYNNELLDGSMQDSAARSAVMSLFENGGGVLTFKDAFGNMDDYASDLWGTEVKDTSAFVLEKVVTNPVNIWYKDGTAGAYWLKHYHDGIIQYNNESNFSPCDAWHFKIELTDDLKRFVDNLKNNDSNFININKSFNENKPQVWVRLNRPAYSGTGAGGFTPGEAKDASVNPDIKEAVTEDYGGNEEYYRIPFTFWANAAAPDLYPFYRTANSTKLSFRSYWAHLTDVNYDANYRTSDGSLRYVYWENGQWGSNNPVTAGFENGAYLEPVRMNSPYTAPDNRSMFLAHFSGPMTLDGDLPEITPSFHRPALFQTLVNNGFWYGFQSLYSAAVSDGDAQEPLLTSLVRKLTPRPLPLDHWNFDGGNDFMGNSAGTMTAEDLARRLSGYYDLNNDGQNEAVQWDVDNDGDGIREGVWIPSGLPIRVDKNGTPYATMYSYTVIDLDGRVNVNTAGNWDQLPNKLGSYNRLDNNGNSYTDNVQPYNYVDELASISGGISSMPGQPFFNVQVLSGGIDWKDDSNNHTDVAVRGDGRGTSNVLLYEVLADAFDSYSTFDVQAIASNLLWRRNLTLKNDPLGKVDKSDLNWETNNQMGSQPGDLANGKETDDSLGTRQEFFRYMDPIRLYDNSDQADNVISLGEANMVFPYRGKTTVDMNTVVSGAVYDFANTAFRSYDPLGAQIYTYAPSYSRNPYLAHQNVLTWQDSPYSLPMLERLLRPWDADAAALPSQLVDDLRMNTDLYGDTAQERERASARQSLTTISSDVPSPSLVFPENNELEDGDYRGGHFGFADLIRKCVRTELYKVFENKDICDPEIEEFANEDGTVDRRPIAGTNKFLTTEPNDTVFDNRVEEITAYLVSMLPPEIMAGEKIDLNALSQKNYWLDIDYDTNGNPVNSTELDGNRDIHNVGLVKRMERARGLYIVMMTLLYEDLNANRLYDSGAGEGTEGEDEHQVADKLDGYIEGSFDLLSFDKDSKKKGLLAQELTATRIAQWCVNTIDFADPDATMTPFFFDPTPFDGWWVYDNDWIEDKDGMDQFGYNRWKIYEPYANGDVQGTIPGWGNQEPQIHFLFDPQYGLPTEQMNDFFRSALEHSEDSLLSNDKNTDYAVPQWVIKSFEREGINTDQRANFFIAKWMSKKIEKLEDQSSDLGFRLVWGMERPDLLLTETLNFHDLGIADTEFEDDTNENAMKVESGFEDKDEDYDQVKRPVGSTYLELYCTANPNVPQSPELYEYDSVSNIWKLALSKTTPEYLDSKERRSVMPIWRIAISASSDPRGINDTELTKGEENESKQAKEELKKTNKVVYNKRRNSVLEWLTPSKSGDDYVDDINFFSFQPKQFRNYPTKFKDGDDPIEITSIGDLDIDQGLDEEGGDVKVKEPSPDKCLDDWKVFNLSSSNILGPAIANTYKDARTREVELDRIVWFVSAQGDSDSVDGMRLGSAGKYPDALRTFCNAASEKVFLEPNQYLVVGPERKRKIGSIAYNKTITNGSDNTSGRFDMIPDSASANANWIDLDNLGTTRFVGNYKYMVAKANIGGRGLNISEPLWTGSKKDPYAIFDSEGNLIKAIDPSSTGEDTVNHKVIDVPFELPGQWTESGTKKTRLDVSNTYYENTVANFPIVQDELFGVGTIPAYKSAFVQRVADPNRPYHPLMNPYITVDWNMMDLTVYTGECIETTENGSLEQVKLAPFSTAGDYPFNEADKTNFIKLAKNVALNLTDDDKSLSYGDAFSSRQWGNVNQKTFAPNLENKEFPKTRPNPWARAFKGQGNKGGLQTPTKLGGIDFAVPQIPRHSLGMYNNKGAWGKWDTEIDSEGNVQSKWKEEGDGVVGDSFYDLNGSYLTNAAGVYMGAPRNPFEHLVWNDAPYSNPMELALVPASAPGRFGLEFVREEGSCDLRKLYKVDPDKGGSLGSFGVFGFKDWYNDDNIKVSNGGSGSSPSDDAKLKKFKGKAGCMGPYLNFFASSRKAGETLNICKALEFVYVPSLYLGTKRLAGLDENDNLITDDNGNTVMFSKRREPGKININTVTGPAWHAISPNSERIQVESRLPGTTWDEFQNSRYPFQTCFSTDASGNPIDDDGDGNQDTYTDDNKPFCYFQPSHTLGLWAQMDKSKSPIPTYTSILAQRDCDLNDDNSVEEDPIFDNMSPDTDGGETLYKGTYFTTPGDPSTKQDFDSQTMSQVEAWQNQYGVDNVTYEEQKYPRNNLYEATAEMQRLSGLTTTRSNAFAVWVTVGYFEVERCQPGVNMPKFDPDGNEMSVARLTDSNDKWYHYYQAIYPDGYTFGKELGSEFGETKRHRGFSIIDRSIPVDYRRGNSGNYKNAVLLQHILD